MLLYTSQGFDPGTAPIDSPTYTQMAGWAGVENRRPVGQAGHWSCLVDCDDQKRTVTLKTTILLFMAEIVKPMTPQQMEMYAAYVKYIIESVWSTSTNLGMTKGWNVTCKVDAKVVTVNEGTLNDGELFISVKRGSGRSFIVSDRRAGVFFIYAWAWVELKAALREKAKIKPSKTDITKCFRDSGYTPAHEFGHAIGLADRYAYICYYLPKEGSAPAEVIVDRAHTVAIFLHRSYDYEYGHKFNWLFNLMAIQNDAFPGSSTAQFQWDGFDPTRSKSVRVHNTLFYQEVFTAQTAPSGPINVSITEKQIDIVGHKTVEDQLLGCPPAAITYFKSIDRDFYKLHKENISKGLPSTYDESYVFRGTFVGLPNSSVAGGPVLHDDGYDSSRNTGLSNNSPLSSKAWFDGEMTARCRQIPPGWSGSLVQAEALNRSGGLLDAALELGGMSHRFAEQTEVDGISVPRKLADLLDIENLDRRISIRRFVREYIQSRVNAAGDFNLVLPPVGPLRSLNLKCMREIKAADGNFFPTDLFSAEGDLYQAQSPATAWLFLPFDYDADSFRPGRIWFRADPGDQTGPGVTIDVQDNHKISVGSSGPGIVYGTGSSASEVAEIWNAGFSPVERWTFNAAEYMPYSAVAYKNRTRLITLAAHGVLKGGNTDGLDPSKFTLERCFEMVVMTYSGMAGVGGPGNSNPFGSYLALRYKRT
jgi:hypothetical protein